MAAFDFFTVPTLRFQVLYCFFIIEHQRRRILHFNATAHPTGDWIVQQLREAPPWPCPYRYILFDRDSKFGGEVREFLKASGIQAVRTRIRSPWQNGVAERWVGSCRREMLDHVIPLHERHVLRLGREYITYYHEDRTHIGLHKETPAVRRVESHPIPASPESLWSGRLRHRLILLQPIPSNHMFAVGVQANSQQNQSSLLNWTWLLAFPASRLPRPELSSAILLPPSASGLSFDDPRGCLTPDSYKPPRRGAITPQARTPAVRYPRCQLAHNRS